MADRRDKYVSGISALSFWGVDWHRPGPGKDLQIAGVNFRPLHGLFDDAGTIKDCYEYVKASGYPIPEGVSKIPCAVPVRAYVEWVYNMFLKGIIPFAAPDDLLFEPEEVEEIFRYLDRLEGFFEDPKTREEFRKWLQSLKSHRS